MDLYHDGHSNESVKNQRRTFKKSPNSPRIQFTVIEHFHSDVIIWHKLFGAIADNSFIHSFYLSQTARPIEQKNTHTPTHTHIHKHTKDNKTTKKLINKLVYILPLLQFTRNRLVLTCFKVQKWYSA